MTLPRWWPSSGIQSHQSRCPHAFRRCRDHLVRLSPSWTELSPDSSAARLSPFTRATFRYAGLWRYPWHSVSATVVSVAHYSCKLSSGVLPVGFMISEFTAESSAETHTRFMKRADSSIPGEDSRSRFQLKMITPLSNQALQPTASRRTEKLK